MVEGEVKAFCQKCFEDGVYSSRNGEMCLFGHKWNPVRAVFQGGQWKDIRMRMNPDVYPKLCPRTTKCRYKHKCKFAHSKEEQQYWLQSDAGQSLPLSMSTLLDLLKSSIVRDTMQNMIDGGLISSNDITEELINKFNNNEKGALEVLFGWYEIKGSGKKTSNVDAKKDSSTSFTNKTTIFQPRSVEPMMHQPRSPPMMQPRSPPMMQPRSPPTMQPIRAPPMMHQPIRAPPMMHQPISAPPMMHEPRNPPMMHHLRIKPMMMHHSRSPPMMHEPISAPMIHPPSFEEDYLGNNVSSLPLPDNENPPLQIVCKCSGCQFSLNEQTQNCKQLEQILVGTSYVIESMM